MTPRLEPQRTLDEVTSGRRQPCPDCPATRVGVLGPMVESEEGCAFRCVSLEAREPLPPRWASSYGLLLVRRGIVVRQRSDVSGRASAIDVAGAGAAIPLVEGADAFQGYAVSDALVCLCPRRRVRAALDVASAKDLLVLHVAALDRIERLVEARGRPTALARVAALLSVLAETLSPPRRLDAIPAALQQRDLAALLGMRHESVCRAIRLLIRRGLVARERDGLRIVDADALQAV